MKQSSHHVVRRSFLSIQWPYILIYLGILFAVVATTFLSLAQGNEKRPLPVPTGVRVNSSAPRVALWNSLSEQEKRLAFHLQMAARSGRAILFVQGHRHGLLLQRFFHHTLHPGKRRHLRGFLGRSAYQEFLAYAAKFNDLGSPYSPSNRKYIFSHVTAAQIQTLLRLFIRQTDERITSTTARELERLLTDPEFEVLRQPEDADDELLSTGGNLYEKGITSAEVRRALEQGLDIDLNCRIRKRSADGALYCERQTVQTPGPVGRALRQVVSHLRQALPNATTDHQRREIEAFIRYFETGNVNDFRQANIEWVQDRTESRVDFMMGFVEVYEDFNGRIGSWESYVQIVDPETTRVSQQLARNAQYFEDQMPYGIWKKRFPADYPPPALMVYYFQEFASMRSGGYNLPNYDDIRRDVGFKNIIRLDLPGAANDPQTRQIFEQAYGEFMPEDLRQRSLQWREKQWQVLVLLHEIIGHGSGTYDTSRYGSQEDPISALGAAGGSALEEQRADLAALVFAADPKLTEIGLYADQNQAIEVRNAMYDTYVATFLLRLSRERTVSESHSRGHWLLVKRLLDRGMVAWEGPNAHRVLRVVNYDGFWEQSRELLAELQRIKAERDESALRTLLAQDAPLEVIEQDWVQSVIRRGQGLAYNAGSIDQPWEIMNGMQLQTRGDVSLEGAASFW